MITRPGVDKVKSEVWFRYSLTIDILIRAQKGRLIMFSLNMLDYLGLKLLVGGLA